MTADVQPRPPRTRSTTAGRGVSGTADPVVELRQIALDRISPQQHPTRRSLGDVAALAESMRDYGLQ